MNAKLDKILNILQPKVEISEIQNPIEEKTEAKTVKVKKEVKKVTSAKKK